MKKIEKIKQQDVDIDGNNSNFWVLLDKINEVVEAVNMLIDNRGK